MPVPDDHHNVVMPLKNYRVKNSEWHCQVCEIYCNSQAQFDVHLISQKHQMMDKKKNELTNSTFSCAKIKPSSDENNQEETKS